MTIGFAETAPLTFLRCASVRDLITSAIAEAKTIGPPYSSDSSSCHHTSYQIKLAAKLNPRKVQTDLRHYLYINETQFQILIGPKKKKKSLYVSIRSRKFKGKEREMDLKSASWF